MSSHSGDDDQDELRSASSSPILLGFLRDSEESGLLDGGNQEGFPGGPRTETHTRLHDAQLERRSSNVMNVGPSPMPESKNEIKNVPQRNLVEWMDRITNAIINRPTLGPINITFTGLPHECPKMFF